MRTPLLITTTALSLLASATAAPAAPVMSPAPAMIARAAVEPARWVTRCRPERVVRARHWVTLRRCHRVWR